MTAPSSSSPAHYLRRLVAERWPRRMIYLDAEAIQDTAGRFVFLLACAIAAVDPEGLELDAGEFTDPADVWQWVDRWTAPKGETRVWTHGLEFDLAVTAARTNLVALGWTPDRFAMRDHGGWWIWRKGSRRLTLCDSSSFLGNAALATIAGDLGVTDAPPLPAPDAPAVEWWARCRADVWIMREALLRVFAWYEAEGIGGLQLSGSSQGMAAYRRRWLPERTVLVHRDEAARQAERDATWAGRCEAWRWGRITGPLEEWDYELAYPRIAAAAVPVRLCRGLTARAEGFTRLERGVCETELPVAPMASSRGVVYPVGMFETVLWSPEIELVRRSGGTWRPYQRWEYDTAPALEPWARWITDQATNHPSPLARRICKQWSRTVIGSFGLRYPVWDVWSTDDAEGSVQVVPYRDGDEDSELLFLGGVVYRMGDLAESENACPQVQSYIWSRARVLLWEAMLAAGLEHVVYCDTDGLIVTRAGGDRLRVWSGAGVGDLAVTGDADDHGGSGDPVRRPPLRLKARYPWAEIHGTRQLILPRETRISGLRRDARRTGPTSWEADVWATMPGGGLGGLEAARTIRRSFTLRRGELRRNRMPGGATRPIDAA